METVPTVIVVSAGSASLSEVSDAESAINLGAERRQRDPRARCSRTKIARNVDSARRLWAHAHAELSQLAINAGSLGAPHGGAVGQWRS
jgi:hypothetical protein